MSSPAGPGTQDLVPRTTEDMEVNGGEPTAVIPRVQEPAEEATSAVSSREQPEASVQGHEQPDPSAQGPSVVDQCVFVHAPQYHWHQEGGVDREARAAIEKLHQDTHSFARETVCHGDKLREDVDELAGVVEQASAALEQQSVFLGGLEQRAQG